ncbi:phage N-6-adenine-methyltransferase [Shewanella algae]|uniref:phage N-6-adenine-methyltransferase n=1 Tax=Shewanella algae TaxID=38313 RepID=UPI003D7DD7C7
MNNYARRLAELKAKPCHLLKEVGDQWRTPDELYWGIFAKFGPFILDIFTDGDNAKCPNFYTVEDNALTQDWTKDLAGGKGFANPPYSRSSYEDEQAVTGMRNIIAKSIEERAKGAKFVYLIKAATSEVWWPEEADHICFIRGRISFDLPEWFIPADKTQESSSAGFACAIAVFDKTWRGERMSYVNRDDLLRDGQVMLDMIAAAAEKKASTYITGTIETRPDTAEQGEPIIAPQVNAQLDIEDQIARDITATNSVWPIEVMNIATEVLRFRGTDIAEIIEDQLQEICKEVNKQRLEGRSTDEILDDLFYFALPTEKKPCAA